MYASDEVIEKVETKITNFNPAMYMSTVRFFASSMGKALRCGRIYEEARTERMFIEEMYESVRSFTQTS